MPPEMSLPLLTRIVYPVLIGLKMQWLLDELAVCASWIGRWGQALKINRHLLATADLPADQRQRIAANLALCERNQPAAA